jgi:hypothetical protein
MELTWDRGRAATERDRYFSLNRALWAIGPSPARLSRISLHPRQALSVFQFNW